MTQVCVKMVNGDGVIAIDFGVPDIGLRGTFLHICDCGSSYFLVSQARRSTTVSFSFIFITFQKLAIIIMHEEQRHLLILGSRLLT